MTDWLRDESGGISSGRLRLPLEIPPDSLLTNKLNAIGVQLDIAI